MCHCNPRIRTPNCGSIECDAIEAQRRAKKLADGFTIEEVEGGQVIRKKPAHRCNEPPAKRYDIGDMFVCGECSTRYVLEDDQREGPFWKRTS